MLILLKFRHIHYFQTFKKNYSNLIFLNIFIIFKYSNIIIIFKHTNISITNMY